MSNLKRTTIFLSEDDIRFLKYVSYLKSISVAQVIRILIKDYKSVTQIKKVIKRFSKND